MSAQAKIDKASPMPYYAQLRELLETEIRAGRLEIGAQLPSEAEMCAHYDVSRTVVRQALMELSNEGFISRVKGKGSFVARPKVDEHLAQNLVGLAEEVSARGQRLDNEILVFEEQLPPEHIAHNLQLDAGETIVRLDRLRSINGEPWVVTATYLPAALCAPLLRLDMHDRSLYETMASELGFVVDHGRRTIEAALAGSDHGALLGIEAGAPLLLLRSLGYLADGRPIEYFIAWHRGDRSRFDVDLERRGTARLGRAPVGPMSDGTDLLAANGETSDTR